MVIEKGMVGYEGSAKAGNVWGIGYIPIHIGCRIFEGYAKCIGLHLLFFHKKRKRTNILAIVHPSSLSSVECLC